MKPKFVQGPVVASSRKKLSEIKQKFSDNVVVFEKGSDPKVILAELQTVSIFEDNRLVVVENPPVEFLENVLRITYHVSLVFWFDKEIDVKKIPQGFEVLFFPEAKEASIFPLLDLLGSKNPKAFVELEKTRPDGSDTQYLITMIFYLLRSLMVPPKNAPPFVKQKIAKQRANFTDGELVDLHKFVLESDYKIKMGLIEPQQAEFNIISKFVI